MPSAADAEANRVDSCAVGDCLTNGAFVDLKAEGVSRTVRYSACVPGDKKILFFPSMLMTSQSRPAETTRKLSQGCHRMIFRESLHGRKMARGQIHFLFSHLIWSLCEDSVDLGVLCG